MLLSNGNGTFQPQTTFAAGSGPGIVTAADVNGDGKPDLVVSDYYGGQALVLPNASVAPGQTLATAAVPALPGSDTGLVVDTTAPAAPAITSPLLTDSPAPVISGTAEAGSTVTLTVGGASYSTLAAGGAWRVDLGADTSSRGTLRLDANGGNSLAATATDPAGNTSGPATQTLTIDTMAPAAPVITSPPLTDSPAPVVSGTAEAGSTVTLTVGGASYSTLAAGGAWRVDLGADTPSRGALRLDANGGNSLTATATDPAGNASGPATQTLTIDTTAPAAPVITSPPLTDSPAPVVSGTRRPAAR